MNLVDACYIGDVEKARKALNDGADPTYNDNSAILWATHSNSLEIVEMLLKDGRTDPTADNNYAIRIASKNGYIQIVEALLQDGRADPAAYDNYSVGWASAGGRVKVVEMLLEDGRVEPPEWAIKYAATKTIKEMLIAYRYRVDGKEYRRMKKLLS